MITEDDEFERLEREQKMRLDSTRERTTMKDLNYFQAWPRATVDKYAAESHVRLLENEIALQQLREDLKLAQNEIRRLIWESSK